MSCDTKPRKRASVLAPRTIADLRARLALPTPARFHPARRVVREDEHELLLDCGHTMPNVDRRWRSRWQTRHHAHCLRCPMVSR